MSGRTREEWVAHWRNTCEPRARWMLAYPLMTAEQALDDLEHSQYSDEIMAVVRAEFRLSSHEDLFLWPLPDRQFAWYTAWGGSWSTAPEFRRLATDSEVVGAEWPMWVEGVKP